MSSVRTVTENFHCLRETVAREKHKSAPAPPSKTRYVLPPWPHLSRNSFSGLFPSCIARHCGLPSAGGGLPSPHAAPERTRVCRHRHRPRSLPLCHVEGGDVGARSGVVGFVLVVLRGEGIYLGTDCGTDCREKKTRKSRNHLGNKVVLVFGVQSLFRIKKEKGSDR